jgi:hypothetical protein
MSNLPEKAAVARLELRAPSHFTSWVRLYRGALPVRPRRTGKGISMACGYPPSACPSWNVCHDRCFGLTTNRFTVSASVTCASCRDGSPLTPRPCPYQAGSHTHRGELSPRFRMGEDRAALPAPTGVASPAIRPRAVRSVSPGGLLRGRRPPQRPGYYVPSFSATYRRLRPNTKGMVSVRRRRLLARSSFTSFSQSPFASSSPMPRSS